jgi:hypothetical protein
MRPRMAPTECSCRSELPVAMKLTLAALMSTGMASATVSDGATATARVNTPNAGVTATNTR